METTQKWCANICIKLLTHCKEEALENCDQRWALSPPTFREREAFGAPNFCRAMEIISRYIECMRFCGVQWLGLRFQFPVIWMPLDQYQPDYKVQGEWSKDIILTRGYKFLGTNMAEAYDIVELHAQHQGSNPDLRKRRP
jgi:hypothetical protein